MAILCVCTAKYQSFRQLPQSSPSTRVKTKTQLRYQPTPKRERRIILTLKEISQKLYSQKILLPNSISCQVKPETQAEFLTKKITTTSLMSSQLSENYLAITEFLDIELHSLLQAEETNSLIKTEYFQMANQSLESTDPKLNTDSKKSSLIWTKNCTQA